MICRLSFPPISKKISSPRISSAVQLSLVNPRSQASYSILVRRSWSTSTLLTLNFYLVISAYTKQQIGHVLNGPFDPDDTNNNVYFNWFTNVRLRALFTGDIALTNALIGLGATKIRGILTSSNIVRPKLFFRSAFYHLNYVQVATGSWRFILPSS